MHQTAFSVALLGSFQEDYKGAPESDPLGTIHLRRQHVLGGEGCPHVPMVKRSQYIRIKNSLHKHFGGMPMVGGGVRNRKNLQTS